MSGKSHDLISTSLYYVSKHATRERIKSQLNCHVTFRRQLHRSILSSPYYQLLIVCAPGQKVGGGDMCDVYTFLACISLTSSTEINVKDHWHHLGTHLAELRVTFHTLLNKGSPFPGAKGHLFQVLNKGSPFSGAEQRVTFFRCTKGVTFELTCMWVGENKTRCASSPS